jgi:hypothetical protein
LDVSGLHEYSLEWENTWFGLLYFIQDSMFWLNRPCRRLVFESVYEHVFSHFIDFRKKKTNLQIKWVLYQLRLEKIRNAGWNASVDFPQQHLVKKDIDKAWLFGYFTKYHKKGK